MMLLAIVQAECAVWESMAGIFLWGGIVLAP